MTQPDHQTTNLASRLRETITEPGIFSGSPVVAASRNLLRDAAEEIERLRAQRDRLVKRLRDAGLSTPFEALNGDEQMERVQP